MLLFNIKDILECLYHSFRYNAKANIKNIINSICPNRVGSEDYYNYKLSRSQSNTIQRRLYEIILHKKSNLVVAIDNTNLDEIWNIVNHVAPHVCMVKFHINTWDIQSFDKLKSLMNDIKQLSNEHNFMIFEDMKLADIDKTSLKQLTNNTYNIHKWADMVTVHAFALTPMIKQVGIGLVIIDSMSHSTSLNLIDEQYADKCHQMISESNDEENKNIVGFVSQDSVKYNTTNSTYIYMTPGVNLSPSKSHDQNYISIEEAFARKADLIIVGSDICQRDNIKQFAQLYQETAWQYSTF